MNAKKLFKRRKALTINAVVDYLRSKGLAVRQCDDNVAIFKINDENILIDVANDRLHLVKSFSITEDTPTEILLLTNNRIMEDRYGIKAYISTRQESDSEGAATSRDLIFSFELFCDGYDEFVKRYEWGIWALLDGIKTHQEIFMEHAQRQPNCDSLSRIGFTTDEQEPLATTASADSSRRKIGFNI